MLDFLKFVFNIHARRGEEHSFILKLATSIWKTTKIHTESSWSLHSQAGGVSTNLLDGKKMLILLIGILFLYHVGTTILVSMLLFFY